MASKNQPVSEKDINIATLVENRTDFKVKTRRDKKNHSAHEQVLDNKTKKQIQRLISAGQISEVIGCLSSGKEAIVFQAANSEGEYFALKIYKRNAMDFRNREKYFDGDYRFRCKHLRNNVRKMVRLWAEKEFRNLRIIEKSGIICPTPLVIKDHLLLMQFIGQKGIASKRLKDINLEKNAFKKSIYSQSVMILRNLFSKCKLVHADFSEYNLLLDGNQVVVIDVGSAVNIHHPNSKEFLITDCKNINDFFHKKNCKTFPLEDLYHFVCSGSFKNPLLNFQKGIFHNVFQIESALNLIDFSQKREEDWIDIKLEAFAPISLFDIEEEEIYNKNLSKDLKHLLANDSPNSLGEESDNISDDSEILTEKSADNLTEKLTDDSEEIVIKKSAENLDKNSAEEILHKKKQNRQEKREMRKKNKREVKAANRERRLHKVPKKEKKKREKALKMRRKNK